MSKLLSLEYKIAVDREVVERGGLYDFVRMAWPVIEPVTFEAAWFLEEICVHLEALSKLEIQRLIINQPPGTGKSTLCNVMWNVWEWIKRPETRFIYASYDATLVGTRDGGKVVQILQSQWFQERWGSLLPKGKPALSNFDNVSGGFRFSTSVGGKVTGRHGDIQVCDDPIKPKDALGGTTQTKAVIKQCSTWWSNTMSTRIRDQRTGRRLLNMQRLTYDDLAGELLATGDYEHLCLPHEFASGRACHTSKGGDRRTIEGELLDPVRFPAPVLFQLKKDLGPAGYAAQAQQQPQVEGGGIFKREWFRFWHHLPFPEPCKCDKCWQAEQTLEGHRGEQSCAVLLDGAEAQTWDMTFKGSEGTDMVAGQVWRYSGSLFFMLPDMVNERLSFVQSKIAMVRMSAKYPLAYEKLVEDKANGPAIESDLKGDLPGITLVHPSGGKEARASAASPCFAAEQVFVPHPSLAPWVYSYLKQLEAFPKAAHDDMVDATSQLLVRLKYHGAKFSEAMRKIRGER